MAVRKKKSQDFSSITIGNNSARHDPYEQPQQGGDDRRDLHVDSDQYPDQTNFYSYARLPDEPQKEESKKNRDKRRKAASWIYVLVIIFVIAFIAMLFYMPQS